MVKRAGLAGAVALATTGCVLVTAKPPPARWEASQPARACPDLILAHVVDGLVAVAGGLLGAWGAAVLLMNGCKQSSAGGEPGQFDCTTPIGAIGGGVVVVGGVALATVAGRRWNGRCHDDVRAHQDWLAARAEEQRARPAPQSVPPPDAGPPDAAPVVGSDAGPETAPAQLDGGPD